MVRLGAGSPEWLDWVGRGDTRSNPVGEEQQSHRKMRGGVEKRREDAGGGHS